MISPIEKKEKERQNNNFAANKEFEDNSPILHLVYKKVPVTKLNEFSIETRRRQYEEQLREKYSIKKEKTGRFL